MSKKFKIVWSLDAFEEKNETRLNVVSFLRRFAESDGAEIDPVYVLSPDELDIPLDINPLLEERYRPAAEKALSSVVQEAGLPGVGKPQVLVESSPSLTKAAKLLARYAERSDADLIVLGTHARTGLPRLFLGSFAETLLLYSQVPVMVIGPNAQPLRPGHILFPTDFGESAGATFERVLDLARRLSARVTIFHSIPHPIEPILQSGIYLTGGGWISASDYLGELQAENRETADRWVAHAKELGIAAKFVSTSAPGSVSQSIVKNADLVGASLIAMVAESGPVAATLLGSVTRQVVRESSCPVWVLRARGSQGEK